MAEYYIKNIPMLRHPEENGYYAVQHRSVHEIETPGWGGPPVRGCFSTIFYMITMPLPIMFIHINRSEIAHSWQAGQAIRYVIVNPDTLEIQEIILGPELHKGQVLQFTCPRGWWKGAELVDSSNQDGFGLVSEAVSPAFDYSDTWLLHPQDIPESHAALRSFCRPEGWSCDTEKEPQANYVSTKLKMNLEA
ncbi:cupin [Thraustotheca clavata]|uniref:Cupin n=1 Tax=Thraustotheca clavata TaxID=74557 RepID=A0A1V9ZAG0_9STRA|nr:cupin [Thraustotheca clavata]